MWLVCIIIESVVGKLIYIILSRWERIIYWEGVTCNIMMGGDRTLIIEHVMVESA